MKKTITLTPKRAKFSAAHSLPCFGREHPCAHLHGHTWWVRATFRGVPDEDGLLVPYEIRSLVERLDHAWLDIDEEDTERIEILEELLGQKIKPAPAGLGLPTGENILAWLVERFCELASNHSATCSRVELTEDPIPGDGHTLVWDDAWKVVQGEATT